MIEKNKKTSGQSILEILIALAILVISISAVVIVSFTNQSISIDTAANHEGLYLAQQSIEDMKAQAKENFDTIVGGTSTSGIYKIDTFVDVISTTEKKVTSRVTWKTETLRPQQTELATIVTKIVIVPGSTGGDTGGTGLTGDWENPQTLGSIDLGAGTAATDLDVINKIVYMTSEAAAFAKPDFHIIDASDGQNPSIVSSIHVDQALNALDATTDYAYVAANSTTLQLWVINVTNRSAPTITSSFSLPGVSGVGAVGNSIFYNDSKIYIGTKTATGPEFHIVDVTDPSNPAHLGSYEVGGDVNAIHVSSGSAYLATSVNSKELMILSVASPTLITELGSYDDPLVSEDAKSLYVVGTKAYIGKGEGSNELVVLETAVPALVQRLGSAPIDDDVVGLVVRDYLAFLGVNESTKELQIWNISDPANIFLWSWLNFPQSISGIDYESNIVYVAVRSNDGLRIITSQ